VRTQDELDLELAAILATQRDLAERQRRVVQQLIAMQNELDRREAATREHEEEAQRRADAWVEALCG